MRRLLTLLTVLAAATAGCVSANVQPAGNDTGTPDAILMGVADCAAAIAVVPVNAEALTPHIPDGFTPWTPVQAGLPADPRGDALLGVEVLECGGVYGMDGILEDAAYGSYFTFVEPPEDVKDADATYHFVKWEHLVADSAYRTLLQDAGVAAVDGAGSVSFVTGAAGARSPFVAELTLGEDVVAFRGTGADEWTDGLEGTFVEFSPATDGLATWTPEFAFSTLASGVGTLTLDADSWTADVVGETTVSAYYLFGHVAHFSGNATLPTSG